jgi:hypothetical protein
MRILALSIIIFSVASLWAQDASRFSNLGRTFSLGSRTTLSGFDSDGFGLGTGGQFRIQLNRRVNTDWFADYIVINANNQVRSEYYHIGWSVLFYPIEQQVFPRLFQPYVFAGHCFDYNKKSMINNPSIYRGRFGSAIQAGIGTHLNLTERLDISLMCQYMFHLTEDLHLNFINDQPVFSQHKHSALEGHLLTTLSIN